MIRSEKFQTKSSKEGIKSEDSKFLYHRNNEKLNAFFSWVDCRERINKPNDGEKKSIGASVEESSKYINQISTDKESNATDSHRRVVRISIISF